MKKIGSTLLHSYANDVLKVDVPSPFRTIGFKQLTKHNCKLTLADRLFRENLFAILQFTLLLYITLL